MIDTLIKWSGRSPVFRRFLWHRWYQYLAGYDSNHWSFMNYGFEPQTEESKILLEADDESDRYCIQLYDRVASAINLEGKRIVEVGSGRGGGCSYVHRYLKPHRTTGIDFSSKAIRFCRRRHDVKGLDFMRGDAEALPMKDRSCDVVLNVESSHCYGSLPRFFEEVHRVLLPGGYFLFADFRTLEDAQTLRKSIEATGLEFVEEELITDGVLRALTLDSERKRELLEALVPQFLRLTFSRFAAIQGSDVYEYFAEGTFVYLRYVFRKPS